MKFIKSIICLFLVGLLLVGVGCGRVKEKVEAMKPTVEVESVKLRGITLTKALLDILISIDNPNPIGITLSKLTFDTYFRDGEKWVFLGHGEKGEMEIRAKGMTTVTIPYDVENIAALEALVNFLTNNTQVDIRVSGSASVKVGPTSFTIPFDTTQTVSYTLPTIEPTELPAPSPSPPPPTPMPTPSSPTPSATATASTSSPTPSAPSIPTPKFTTPGTGAAVGQVMFPDGTPAHGSVVYIFKSEETRSFASCYVDTNGYYIFDNLPPGRYDIYTASYATFWGFTGSPDATISVSEHETTVVPTLTVLRHIEITLDNPKIATFPGKPYTSKYVIDGHNPKFTWTSVPNAAYYIVTIWSTYTEENPSNRDYEESQQVVKNMVVWPTSLSSLPYQEFRIDVEAYMDNGVLIASGYENFAVDNPPDGWVFK